MAAVCVFCASGGGVDERYVSLAAALGTALAGAGHSLVWGGAQVSMMGAVARAARAGGAHTTGVIPRSMTTREIADRDADELVVVETMRERKRIMAERSDAFVALPGGLGTLEELLEVWTTRSLDLQPQPVIVLDPDGFYDPLWRFLDDLVTRGFARAEAVASALRVTTVEATLALLPAP